MIGDGRQEQLYIVWCAMSGCGISLYEVVARSPEEAAVQASEGERQTHDRIWAVKPAQQVEDRFDFVKVRAVVRLEPESVAPGRWTEDHLFLHLDSYHDAMDRLPCSHEQMAQWDVNDTHSVFRCTRCGHKEKRCL